MSDIKQVTEATNKIIELYTKGLVTCKINDYKDVTVYNQDGKEIARAYTTHLESNGEEVDWEYILQVYNWNTWKATATQRPWASNRQPLEDHIRNEKYRLARTIKKLERDKRKVELTTGQNIFNLESGPEELKEILRQEELEIAVSNWAKATAEKCSKTIKILNKQLADNALETWDDETKQYFLKKMGY